MNKKRSEPVNNNLILDPKMIGNNLLKIRKKRGMSQEETAWATGLSSRAYADIERGAVNARLDSILKICRVFEITPNDILINKNPDALDEDSIMIRLDALPQKEHETALRMLQTYIEICND